jgi:EmrB/QacA subfamily drug resistance transporter
MSNAITNGAPQRIGMIVPRERRAGSQASLRRRAELAEQGYTSELAHAGRPRARQRRLATQATARQERAVAAVRSVVYARTMTGAAAVRSAVSARTMTGAAAVRSAVSARTMTGAAAVRQALFGRRSGERPGGASSHDGGPQTIGTGPSRSERRRWIALAVLCLGQLMMILDSTIVNVALPSIQRDLHFSQGNLTWVMNGYLITFGGLLLLAGRLGDLIGRKRVFLTGLALFTASSVLCGIADSQALLIGFRLLQGAGGAVASSVILAIIVTEFPKRAEQARAMGVYAFVSAGGGSIGLLAGGALTQSLNWHWIFFVNVPIGLVAFILGSILIEENEGIGLAGGIDVLGSVLITLAAMLGAFAIVKSSEYGLLSARTLGIGGTSLALLAAFLWLEGRVANPIMPLRILRLRTLMGSSLVRGLLVTGMFSAFFLGSLYLERVLGYDAIDTGLAFMPLTISIAVLSMGPAARAMARFGAVRTLSAGLTGIVAGLVLLATRGVGASYFPGLFGAFLLLGLGAGASFLPLLTVGMSDAPKRDAGLASGIINVSVQLFGAIGLATLGTIATDHTKALTSHGTGALQALTGGYHLSYLVGAALVACGIIAAFTLLRPPRTGVLQEIEDLEARLVGGQAQPEAQAA